MLGWIHATSLWVKPVNQQPNPLSNVLMKNQSNSLQQQAHTLDSMATHYIPYHRLSIQNWQGWNGKLILLFFSIFLVTFVGFLSIKSTLHSFICTKMDETCYLLMWILNNVVSKLKFFLNVLEDNFSAVTDVFGRLLVNLGNVLF